MHLQGSLRTLCVRRPPRRFQCHLSLAAPKVSLSCEHSKATFSRAAALKCIFKGHPARCVFAVHRAGFNVICLWPHPSFIVRLVVAEKRDTARPEAIGRALSLLEKCFIGPNGWYFLGGGVQPAGRALIGLRNASRISPEKGRPNY
ncbi:hypothetical protein EVAR_78932_1 [Eumeta japonica]|uniref:Uncharacterized protein n=1 Tax=Eumeta variegata TaxID=151549 RepID=A0A4C1U2F2_EUMVA|nr:hypothetical protein EVAR_78932_1 [Eumeta japonica]